MSINEEQPTPIATIHRPAWELVIEYVKVVFPSGSDAPVVDVILQDMAERDQLGRKRYGVPLTAHNGRDPMVDAYQEALDYAVYLMAALDELGVIVNGRGGPTKEPDQTAEMLGQVFSAHMAMLPMLRQLILNKPSDPTPPPSGKTAA